MPLNDTTGKVFNNIFVTNTDAKLHGCTSLSGSVKHNLKKTSMLGAKLILCIYVDF